MKTTTKMKISLVLAVGFLLVFSKSLFACHQGLHMRSGLEGHSASKVGKKHRPTNFFFDVSTGPTVYGVASSFYATTDSVATSTDCHWRTANIEKFFNESYEQIAEESAQGSGQHLEALAALTGCSAEQYGTFETEAISDRSDSNSSMICLVPVIGIVKTFCDSWQCREPWPARCPDRRWWPRH